MNNSLMDGCITKKCTKCGEEKDKEEFYRRGDSKDGYFNNCKRCILDKQKKYYSKPDIKIKLAEYYQNNKEHMDATRKRLRADNIKRYKGYDRKSREKRKKEIREYYKRWKAIPENRIRVNLTNRVHASLKKYTLGYVNTSLWKEVGCDKETLKKHLEGQFTDGMTWDNYGEWHVDHIKPWASFCILDEQQRKECSHYTNLQPLWADDNRMKSNKLDWVKDTNSRHSL